MQENVSEKIAASPPLKEPGLKVNRAEMASRYGRHFVLQSFGVQAQEKLCKASVLIVGAGGLGSPAALYLAGAGIGKVGVADKDVVELSNLHRQVIHGEASIGLHKAESAAATLRRLNSWIEVIEHRDGITPANALSIISQYSVVLDASDNAPTRYLLSDACVIAGKPLVSGAALGMDGQLTVYNYKGGPCYRCIFPQPPSPTACQRCSDAGVLGVVPGVIGTLQALEAIKIIAEVGEPLSSRLLLFDALSTRIHTVTLRRRMPGCTACGDNRQLTKDSLPEFDYAAFTQTPLHDQQPLRVQLVSSSQSISVKEYNVFLAANKPHILLDVRPPHQFEIGTIPGAVNFPLPSLETRLQEITTLIEVTRSKVQSKRSKPVPKDGSRISASSEQNTEMGNTGMGGLSLDDGEGERDGGEEEPTVFVVCRRGNDSQLAVESLQKHGISVVVDITGGLQAWAAEIDPHFPIY